MRKRFPSFGPETWTNRGVMIYSLGLGKLEPKRIFRFCTVPSGSGHHETFFENSRFWRFSPGFCQLAPGASVLLYKQLAKEAKDALRVILGYYLGIRK